MLPTHQIPMRLMLFDEIWLHLLMENDRVIILQVIDFQHHVLTHTINDDIKIDIFRKDWLQG